MTRLPASERATPWHGAQGATARSLVVIDFGWHFTIVVEVLYSESIRQIADRIPDHLPLTETDNPAALKWLNKNDEIGMPTAKASSLTPPPKPVSSVSPERSRSNSRPKEYESTRSPQDASKPPKSAATTPTPNGKHRMNASRSATPAPSKTSPKPSPT